MSAGKLDITIEQGAKFSKTLKWTDAANVAVPLTGLKGRMQVRESLEAAASLLDLHTDTGEIIIEQGAEVGRIDIVIGATVTAAITWITGIYDLEIFDPGDADNVTRLIEGKVTIRKEVTKST